MIHVIPPAQRVVVTPDLGIEGVIEEDDATRKKVVSKKHRKPRSALHREHAGAHMCLRVHAGQELHVYAAKSREHM